MRRALGLLLIVGAIQVAGTSAWAQASQQDPQQAVNRKPPQDFYRTPEASAGELGKAVDAVRAKRYHAAIASLDRYTNGMPANPAAWRLMGVAYAGKQQWASSRRAYERALRLAPDDIVSHAGRGRALLALNDPRAQQEAAWLKARMDACGTTCPEAPLLQIMDRSGPFATPTAD